MSKSRDEWKRKVIAIEALAEALDPIHQGGETTGTTTSELRREKVIVNGVVEYLPVISANSLAHHLRENCVFWVLDQIGFDTFKPNSERAFKLLFSGGGKAVKPKDKMDKDKHQYIDLAEEAELRALFPTISLFGGTIGNRMEKGRMRVENILPVCREMAARLPDWMQADAALYSIADLIDEQSFTAADPRENSDYRNYIDSEIVRQYRAKQESRLKDNKGGSDMKIRHTVECLAAGTKLYLGVLLQYITPIEVGVFLGGLSYFHEKALIGGKTNRGFGRIKFQPRQFEMSGFTRVAGELASETMQAASEHLVKNMDEIKRILDAGEL